MYCPGCFNDSLNMARRGVIHIVINDKKMDTGQMLFNLDKEKEDKVQDHLIDKIEEFFKWYSNFQNKEPISRLAVYSGDFICNTGCKLPMDTKISIIEHLFKDPKMIKEALIELGKKYKLVVKIIEDE